MERADNSRHERDGKLKARREGNDRIIPQRKASNSLNCSNKEINFLILKYLNASGFESAALLLERDMIAKDALSHSGDWHTRKASTFRELEASFPHVGPLHLQSALAQLLVLSHEKKNFVGPVWSLIGQGVFSVLPERYTLETQPLSVTTAPIRSIADITMSARRTSVVSILRAAELGTLGSNCSRFNIAPFEQNKFKHMKTVRGHKLPTYCLVFDMSGRRFVTGSDDRLVKVWCSVTGGLIRTLRCHWGDITDLAISYDNKYLASASNDATIRIWDFRTFRPIALLEGHQDSVNVTFSPSPYHNILISCDTRGGCKLWNVEDFDKPESPKSIDLAQGDGQASTILSCAFNTGGTRFITSGDAIIRVWAIDPPQCVGNLVGHAKPVRSIRWNHGSDRILSGADDATVRIWKYTGEEWKDMILPLHGTLEDLLPTLAPPEGRARTSNAPSSGWSSTMVLWSLDDNYVASAATNMASKDHTTESVFIKVWNSNTGELVHTLSHHTSKIWVLENHPREKRIIMSAAYDGMVILWDILCGRALQIFNNDGHPQFCDGKFSRDGSCFAVTDKNGQTSIYGTGNPKNYEKTEKDQFFTSDYNQLVVDMLSNVNDAVSEMPPHLTDSGPLCDSNGIPYDVQPTYSYTWPALDQGEFDGDRFKRTEMAKLEMRMKFTPEKPLEAVSRGTVDFDASESEEEELNDEELSDQEDFEDFNDYEDDESAESENDPEDESAPPRQSNRLRREMKRKRRSEKNWLRRSKRRKTGASNYAESEEDISSEEEEEQLPAEDSFDQEGMEISPPPAKKKLKRRRRKGIPTEWASWLVEERQLEHSYHPQIGDRVHYFRQGHAKYLAAFPEESPWNHMELSSMEICTVASVKYVVDSPSYAVMELKFEREVEGRPPSFFVSFHPEDDMTDFMVLAKKMEACLEGDPYRDCESKRFSMYYPDQEEFFHGKISKKSPVDETFPDSLWECLDVIWDSEEQQRISPWEISTLEDRNFIPEEPREHLSQDQIEFFAKQIQTICKIKIAQDFVDRVSIRVPGYLQVIAYPMDLSTILMRLTNNFYRRLEALRFDCGLIMENACRFNKSGTSIYVNSKALNEILNDVLDGKQVVIGPEDEITGPEGKEEVSSPIPTAIEPSETRSTTTTSPLENSQPKVPHNNLNKLKITLKKTGTQYQVAESSVSEVAIPPPVKEPPLPSHSNKRSRPAKHEEMEDFDEADEEIEVDEEEDDVNDEEDFADDNQDEDLELDILEDEEPPARMRLRNNRSSREKLASRSSRNLRNRSNVTSYAEDSESDTEEPSRPSLRLSRKRA